MNNQAPIGRPERTQEYHNGASDRRQGITTKACPWDFGNMLKRSLWLAGWHDTDMAMSEGRNP
ncbi:hypothetical protein D9M68_437280 [compost metagenome]